MGKTIKRTMENGKPVSITFEEYDGITNRLSIGGDSEHGYYIVARCTTMAEGIKCLEAVLKEYKGHSIDECKKIVDKGRKHQEEMIAKNLKGRNN